MLTKDVMPHVTPQPSDELFIDARLKKKEARKKIVKIKMTFLDRKHKINKETNISCKEERENRSAHNDSVENVDSNNSSKEEQSSTK
jgi:hypothetical protein